MLLLRHRKETRMQKATFTSWLIRYFARLSSQL
jgi:hypothetical protein